MARPLKGGVDYFPLDCHFSDSVKLLQAEFGMAGLGVLIRLWQKIYGEKGYFCEWSKEVALLFAQEIGLGGNVVSEIIRACLRRGIFDQKMYADHGILTSEGIQERYLAITNRRKESSIFGGYALVKCAHREVNVDKNAVNASKNRVIARNNPQSKGNKSKANKNESMGDTPARLTYGTLKNVLLTKEEHEDLCRRIPNAEQFIDYFSVKISAKGYQYDSHYAALLSWHREDQKKNATQQDSSSFDVDEFFEAALARTYGEDKL